MRCNVTPREQRVWVSYIKILQGEDDDDLAVDGPLSMEVMANRWQDFRLLPPPGYGEAEEDGVIW
jgi:hypothetical protein